MPPRLEAKRDRWNRFLFTAYAPLFNVVEPFFRSPRRKAIGLLALKPGDRVLVLGCGTGLDLEFFPSAVEVEAVDLAPAMVWRTARRAKRLGTQARVRVMSAQALDFEPQSFDAVVLHLVLTMFADPQAVMAEVARVLKPQGKASLLDHFLGEAQRPSRLRQALNWVAYPFFYDLNLPLGPLLEAGGMEVLHKEEILVPGTFWIYLVQKTG